MSADDAQLQNLDRLLKNWATNITETTKDIISSAIQGHGIEEPKSSFHAQNNQIFDDIRDRQSRVISTIQEAHNRQLDLLKTAIGDERKEFARAQAVFEQSLRTKYEHSIEALRETIQSELDSRMIRTLKNLEYQAKLEGERARQAHDFEYEVESRLTARLKMMISDLRKSWEEEETSRIKQTEEKLRSNYNIVLEHMEAQLRMALQLQEDADEKWLEELDQRNKKQLESVKLFEEKCRKLYETRLIDYAEKTSSQISSYEDKLLEVGSIMAAEKNQFESRLRRIKLACTRWKIAYQSDVHSRYREMTASIDDRYALEIAKLLTEIKDLKQSLSDTQRLVEMKEREIKKTQEMYNTGKMGNSPAPAQLRGELTAKWDELKLSPVERIDTLAAMLDAAQTTPEMLTLFETINAKLSARQPIAQLTARKQFIEYKLKLSIKAAGEGGPGSLQPAEKAALIQELTEVKANLERLSRQFEKDYGDGISVSISAPPTSQPIPVPAPINTSIRAHATDAEPTAGGPTAGSPSSTVQSRIHALTKSNVVRRPIGQ